MVPEGFGVPDNICQFEVFISFRIEVDRRGWDVLSGRTDTSHIRMPSLKRLVVYPVEASDTDAPALFFDEKLLEYCVTPPWDPG